jgi:hypothetical protein
MHLFGSSRGDISPGIAQCRMHEISYWSTVCALQQHEYIAKGNHTPGQATMIQ